MTQPPWFSVTSTTIPKKRLRSSTTSSGGRRGRERGRADHVDEEHGDVAHLAAELDLAVQRRLSDLAADVAAEQVAHALALLQTGGHAVEAGLEQPDLAGVVDLHPRLEVAAPRRR